MVQKKKKVWSVFIDLLFFLVFSGAWLDLSFDLKFLRILWLIHCFMSFVCFNFVVLCLCSVYYTICFSFYFYVSLPFEMLVFDSFEACFVSFYISDLCSSVCIANCSACLWQNFRYCSNFRKKLLLKSVLSQYSTENKCNVNLDKTNYIYFNLN